MMRHNSPPLLITSFFLMFVGAVTVAWRLGGLWGPLVVFPLMAAFLIHFWVLVKNEAIIRDELVETRAQVARNTEAVSCLREGLAGVLDRERDRGDAAPVASMGLTSAAAPPPLPIVIPPPGTDP